MDAIQVAGLVFQVGDLVKFAPVGDQDLPEGITANRVYFVTGVNGSNITVSETAGGPTVDITADGVAIAQKAALATITKNDNAITFGNLTLAVGDLVAFTRIGNTALPGGLTEGTAFFVKTVNGNSITISATAGGNTLDITSDGTAAIQKIGLNSITDSKTPNVPNEPDAAGRSNIRGTIAMAKGAGPDSATSQFFFNIHDSSSNLNTQNGGFTVFGRVVDTISMQRIDAAAAVKSQDRSDAESGNPNLSAFTEMPLRNYTAGTPDIFPNDALLANFFAITGVTINNRPEFLTYAVVHVSDPNVVEAVIHPIFIDRLNLNFKKSGTATITIRATDKAGLFVDTTFTISHTNAAPIANNDTYSTTEDTPLTRTAAIGVLANDTDADLADRTNFKAILVSGPANGTVHLNEDGSFTYTPNQDFNGVDTFTYKVNDGHEDSNVATVTITVTAINDAPIAQNGTLVTAEDTPATGQLIATDVDSPTLTYSLVDTTNARGTVTITNTTTGTYLYTPAANFHGTASFTFRASDGSAISPPATITITVTAVNDAPTAFAES
ncbi:MAG: tandem-95 repeat protein, partial [Gemmataceae bacterium]|nr:tandem-95 repeat protein [Gemmataceae bacterium]